MNTAIKYIFIFIWLAVGLNLAWQMRQGGADLLHPLNATFLGLIGVGIITAFFGPRSRCVSALCGVLLAGLLIYLSWDIWLVEIDDGTTISTKFWGIEVFNRSAQILPMIQTGVLLLFSFASAYMDARQLGNPAHQKNENHGAQPAATDNAA